MTSEAAGKSTALATTTGGHQGGMASLMPTPGEWAMLSQMAQVLVETKFVPDNIKTANQALAVMLKARELGVPAMMGLNGIGMVQGKISVSAELMAALIYRDHGNTALDFVEASDKKCTIAYHRRGGVVRTLSFTWEDAVKAGLTQKGGPWKLYPGAMLRARAISAVARMAFADTIGGMYTPEELGAPVVVDAEGNVVADPAYLEEQAREVAQPPAAELGALKARLLELCSLLGIAPPTMLREVKDLSRAHGVEPAEAPSLVWYGALVAALEEELVPTAGPPPPPAAAPPTRPTPPPVPGPTSPPPPEGTSAYDLFDSLLEKHQDLGMGEATIDQLNYIKQGAEAIGVSLTELARVLAILFPLQANAQGLCPVSSLERGQAAAIGDFLRHPVGQEATTELLKTAGAPA